MSVRLTPWTNPYQSGIGTEITEEKEINVVLRDTNNLIQLTQNNELYTDLQLANWLKPTDTIPVWVTTGRVLSWDGRPVTWTLVCSKTTSWDITMYLYWDNWTIYVNNWGNTWKILQQQLTAWTGITIENNVISTNILNVCTISLHLGQNVTGTIESGEYVDGAIIVLIGSTPIDATWIEVTVDWVAHQLMVYPRDWQTWEYLMPTSATTWMLKIWWPYDVLFHRQGWEWWIPQ